MELATPALTRPKLHNNNFPTSSLRKGVVKLYNSLAHSMAVHLLSSLAATFSSVITPQHPPTTSGLSHSFILSFLSFKSTPSSVNIFSE